jgi:cytoskeletal protein CcmA (bactofilin family)/Zn finger protein HypA/HybF involved in hydrogenase expression
MADEPQRHRIQVACPECGHLQTEPALVVSTQCRSCRTNFQVRDGKGVVRSQSTVRVAKPRMESELEPPPPEAKVSDPPRFNRAVPPPRPFWMRWFWPAKPPRHVSCFNCHHAFMAIAEAQSSQCPKCGGYVSLIDHEITTHSNTRIETRGNVIIQKTGVITDTLVRCHDLTVHGQLRATAECSGDLVISSSGKITGAIHCRHLRVEKGAHVEFLQPLSAESATIDGDVRGQISCSGPIILEKRARLHGLVRASDLIVKTGARHTGTVEMLDPLT